MAQCFIVPMVGFTVPEVGQIFENNNSPYTHLMQITSVDGREGWYGYYIVTYTVLSSFSYPMYVRLHGSTSKKAWLYVIPTGTLTVSGRVVKEDGNGLEGVYIDGDGTTDINGNWVTTKGIPYPGGTFTPSKTGYTFDPPSVSWSGTVGNYYYNLGGVTILAIAAPLPLAPINPQPFNGSVIVDFNLRTLNWENGGGALSYDVYIGDSPSNLSKVSSAQAGTSYLVTDENRTLFKAHCYWRIDAKNGSGTTTGDVWNFSIAHPTKTKSPTPVTNSIDISKNLYRLAWIEGD